MSVTVKTVAMKLDKPRKLELEQFAKDQGLLCHDRETVKPSALVTAIGCNGFPFLQSASRLFPA